jgi:hypothetical protein
MDAKLNKPNPLQRIHILISERENLDNARSKENSESEEGGVCWAGEFRTGLVGGGKSSKIR